MGRSVLSRLLPDQQIRGELHELCIRSGAVPMLIPVFAPPDSDLYGQRVTAIGAPAKVAPTLALPDPFLAEDYVRGMELLGFRFTLAADAGEPVLFLMEPDELPEAWDRHATRLRGLFGRERNAEAIAYLRDREGRT